MQAVASGFLRKPDSGANLRGRDRSRGAHLDDLVELGLANARQVADVEPNIT